MPSVKVEMDLGVMGVETDAVPYVPPETSKAKPATLKTIADLISDGVKLAAKRGGWKTASAEDRKATYELREKHAKLTAQAVIEHNNATKGIN